MARDEFYSEVDRRMWGDAKVKHLDPTEKLVWCWLLNNTQHTRLPGVFRFWVAMLADETGIATRRARGALARLTQLGMVRHDEATGLTLLPNAIRRRIPRSPDNVRGWKKDFGALPECDLRHEIARTFAKTLSESRTDLGNAWSEVVTSDDRPSTITSTSVVSQETLPDEKGGRKGGTPHSHTHSHEQSQEQGPPAAAASFDSKVEDASPVPETAPDIERVVGELLRVAMFAARGRAFVETRARRLAQMADGQSNGRRPIAPYVRVAVDKLETKLREDPLKAAAALSWVFSAAEGAWHAKKLDRRSGESSPADAGRDADVLDKVKSGGVLVL